MKFIITESKAEQIILKYLNDYFVPDTSRYYKWGDDPIIHKFYQEDVDKYGKTYFYIGNYLVYTYNLNSESVGFLEVHPYFLPVIKKMDKLFGNLWERKLMRWFEENTGLKVDELIINRFK